MKTSYETTILGFGNHASIEIPTRNVAELGGSKRAPLKITINGHTYQSTATAVDGVCMVVFPTRDRIASGVASGDRVMVTLELDAGYREVAIPMELAAALKQKGVTKQFHNLTYSKRKEFSRQVAEAKSEDTRKRRIAKVIEALL